MDEVIAATAYLDLFLRTVYEPALLKVFLKFILCAKIDEMNLLDTLINRINFTTKVKRTKNQTFEKFKFLFLFSLD
jgi:hypothetical protein